jgi:nickel transport system ATP-binding protein
MLTLSNVSKTYFLRGQFSKKISVPAVNDVSLHVHQGDCLGVVGESGSGKSTLGRMIVGLEKSTGGEIVFCGEPIERLRAGSKNRRYLQMVYQNSFDATNPRFTALDIIAEPLKNFSKLSGHRLRDRVAELLRTVEIPETEMNKHPSEFSGGQLQRICIARALACEPRLIVLDEPLRSLDVSVQAQMLNMLKDLMTDRNLSYIFISHDLEAVYYLTNRLVVMFGGNIVEQIDDMALFERLRHPYSLELLEASKFAPLGARVNGEVRFENGCVYANRCQEAKEKCFCKNPRLRRIENNHLLACHLFDSITVQA